MKRLLVVTNIPTPYRAHFFNTLSATASIYGWRIKVVYCAEREWNRNWQIAKTDHAYEWQQLDGYSLKLKDITVHWNPEIYSVLEIYRPHLILSAGAWWMPTGVFALLLRHVFKYRTMFWSEGHRGAVLHAGGLVAFCRRKVLRQYDAFAVPNNRSLEFISQERKSPVACIRLPNTVDECFYVVPSEGERRTAQDRCGINSKEKTFVQVSQIEDRKGVIELCEAFSQLTIEDVRLVLVGSGSKVEEIKAKFSAQMRSGRIVLTGSVDKVGVRDWLHAADVFVLATKRDPNPLSVIEAALCGKPLIISSAAGNVQDLVTSETGWLIEDPTPTCIKEKLLLACLAPASDLALKGKVAAHLAREQFSTTKVASEFMEKLNSWNKNNEISQ